MQIMRASRRIPSLGRIWPMGKWILNRNRPRERGTWRAADEEETWHLATEFWSKNTAY
jgi:hypothetical protein